MWPPPPKRPSALTKLYAGDEPAKLPALILLSDGRTERPPILTGAASAERPTGEASAERQKENEP